MAKMSCSMPVLLAPTFMIYAVYNLNDIKFDFQNSKTLFRSLEEI